MSSAYTLLTENGQFKHKVSSVLNGLAEFAGKKMVQVHSIQLTFQGGFVGQECVIEAGQSTSQLSVIKDIQYIEDSNATHEFLIDSPHNEDHIRYLKITFNQSTDFYGRITVYALKVFGTAVVS
eukprot:gene12622-14591_t